MSSNGQEKETTFYDPNVLNEAFSSCAYNIFAHCDHVVDTSEYFNSTAIIFVLFEFLANTWTWYLNRAAIDIFQMTTLIWNHLNTSFHWHVFFWHSKRWNCILALPKEKKTPFKSSDSKSVCYVEFSFVQNFIIQNEILNLSISWCYLAMMMMIHPAQCQGWNWKVK